MELKDLKVGDKVIYSSTIDGEFICKVHAITPKGFIKVGSKLHDPRTGIQRGGGWYSSKITIPTEEQINDIQNKYNHNEQQIKDIENRTFINNTLSRLKSLKTLTYEQAIKIEEIMEW